MTDKFEMAQADAPAYTHLLPWHSVDPEGNVVFLAQNADGIPDKLGLVWKLALLQAESTPNEALGHLAARLDNLLKAVPDETPLQFILRSSRNVRALLENWQAATRNPDPLLRDLASSRRASLERLSVTTATSAFEMRSLEVLMTLVRPGSWARTEVGPLDALRGAAEGGDSPAERRIAEAYGGDRRRVVELAATLESLMAQAGLAYRRLPENELADELHASLNPLRSRTIGAPEALPDELLRERVALSGMAVDLDLGTIKLDDLHAKIVSVIGLPRPKTRAGMLMRAAGGAAMIDTVPDMDLVFNVYVHDQEKMKLRFGGARRLAQDQSKDVYERSRMSDHAGEFLEIERDLAQGDRVITLRIHAIVRGKSADEAGARARTVCAAFQSAGFRAVVEDVLAPTLLLQSLPLCYRPVNDGAIRRGRLALTANLAHLVPVYGAFAGTPQPTQLLLNRRGQPVYLSFFNDTGVPHALVTGKSGSGKSVFANDLILSALRTGGRVWVLDRGGSYRKLTEMMEGAYVGYDAKRPPRLNPCGIAPDDGTCPEEANEFLRDWLTQMATQGKSDLPVPEQNLLSKAVRAAFGAKPGEEVFLRDIHRALLALAGEHPEAKRLALSIAEFVNDGTYARYFDGPNEVDFEKPLVAVDLGDAALVDAVTSVLVMALMYRIAQASKAWLAKDKYLVIDEAWTLLKSPACARFIENVSRTARKFRLSLVILSQQITDLEGPSGRAILAQTAYKVLLHQDPESVRLAAELLGLGSQEVALYGSLRTLGGVYSELMVKSPYGSGVARLAMDPLAYWVATSDMRDRVFLERLVEQAVARGALGREALRQALLEASLKHPKGAPAETPPVPRKET